MSTTDNDAASADNFWSDLRCRIARAASMTPVEASQMMGRSILTIVIVGRTTKRSRRLRTSAQCTSGPLRSATRRQLKLRLGGNASTTAGDPVTTR
jgi:hypothetical protein